MSQVGEHAQHAIAVGAAQLQWLARVVRNGKGQQAQRADAQHLPVLGRRGGGRCGGGQAAGGAVQRLPGAGAGVQGNVVTGAEHRGAANVIAMLMGDENGVDVFGAESLHGQALQQLAPAQAAIDKHARALQAIGGFDERGVATAAAGQAAKAEHAGFPSWPRGRKNGAAREMAWALRRF